MLIELSNMKTIAAIVCFIVFSTVIFASAADNNCTAEFKSLLEQAADVKNHCNIKGFYDCCEVRKRSNTFYD